VVSLEVGGGTETGGRSTRRVAPVGRAPRRCSAEHV